MPGYDRLVNGLMNGLGPGTRVVDVAADGRDRDLSTDILLLPYGFRLGVEVASQRLAAEPALTASSRSKPSSSPAGKVP